MVSGEKIMKMSISSWVIFLLIFSSSLFASTDKVENEPDSAYLFAYEQDHGLHFAWSINRSEWHPIGPHSFVRCDYGTWGGEKKMYDPYLYQDDDNLWHCVWSVNHRDGTFAYTSSKDLINWSVQTYPFVMEQGNCLYPEISSTNSSFIISWLSGKDKKVYKLESKDLIHFGGTVEGADSDRLNLRTEAIIANERKSGTIHPVPWGIIDQLIRHKQLSDHKNLLYSEKMAQDPQRFAGLKTITATVEVKEKESKPISDLLMGIFLEDINYALDGGLYAELIQNRDFEYNPSDRKEWNNQSFWEIRGEGIDFSIDTEDPIHLNNAHYAVLDVKQVGAGLLNKGYDGIPLMKGEKYDFSLFVRLGSFNKGGKLKVQLIDEKENVIAEKTMNKPSNQWKKQHLVFTAKETVNEAQLRIIPGSEGIYHLDMVSLFPQKTFKGRKNGLRADLAQVLADIKPRFVRFPGGCLAHGNGLDNMYRWKNTVGPLEARKPQGNLWGYHQSAGVGYYEFFQFCEDINAEPVPVVPAGVPCQNSSAGGAGQQGGIPMCEMDDYVQEVLDLIEWANGDKNTKWGRVRAEAGHPEPFNLKYIGVGNEDLITHIFKERFEMIYDAVKKKHPEIEVIGTVGPFSEGSDYVEGWNFATKIGIPIVDEHYYQPPGWYIHNPDYYDRYDRNKSKVYLGEYAAHLPNRHNNIETALAEALHLNNVERNGDIVIMTSYAPLLAKEGYTQWNPDLIYFNNKEVKPTTGYYVQKMFGENTGNHYLPSNVYLSDQNDAVQKRFSVSVVKDEKTADYIIKMVNMLPTSIDAELQIPNLDLAAITADCTVLQGDPDDRSAKPVTQKVEGINKVSLPAYSYTVLRFK